MFTIYSRLAWLRTRASTTTGTKTPLIIPQFWGVVQADFFVFLAECVFFCSLKGAFSKESSPYTKIKEETAACFFFTNTFSVRFFFRTMRRYYFMRS